MQTAELVALPLAERLQAMEALWDSLCRDPAQAQTVPNWHQDVLSQGSIGVRSCIDASIDPPCIKKADRAAFFYKISLQPPSSKRRQLLFQ